MSTRRRSRRRRLLFGTITACLLLAAASGLDHLAGWIGARRAAALERRGWIFPPRTHAELVTSEFRHTIQTSSQGLRDRDYALPAPPGTLRIAAVGDSFTYGWGVDLERAWIKVLERQLQRDRPDRTVEVVNLGRPGADPETYAQICETTLAQLRPDLLLVGVTQGDDLTQLALHAAAPPVPRKVHWLQDAVRATFPTTAALCQRWTESRAGSIRRAMRRQAREVLDRFTPEEMARYHALDRAIRRPFERGLINPLVIREACLHPTFFSLTLDPATPPMIEAAARLRAAFDRIDRVCRATQTPWLVVSVPYGVYVSRAAWAGRRRLGFVMTDDLLRTDAPDRIVARVCAAAGVPFVSVTEDFRRRAAGAFYPIDGHLTAAGHQLFATLIEPAVLGWDQHGSSGAPAGSAGVPPALPETPG